MERKIQIQYPDNSLHTVNCWSFYKINYKGTDKYFLFFNDLTLNKKSESTILELKNNKLVIIPFKTESEQTDFLIKNYFFKKKERLSLDKLPNVIYLDEKLKQEKSTKTNIYKLKIYKISVNNYYYLNAELAKQAGFISKNEINNIVYYKLKDTEYNLLLELEKNKRISIVYENISFKKHISNNSILKETNNETTSKQKTKRL